MRLLTVTLALFLIACGSQRTLSTTEGAKDRKAAVNRALSTSEPLYKQFWKIEQERLDAGRLKDVAAINAVTSDEYIQVDWRGNVLDKSAAMSRIGSSAIQIRSNILEELQVRKLGDLVLVVGRATRMGSFQGKDISETVRYSRLYRRNEGRWQVVFFQQTPIPALLTESG